VVERVRSVGGGDLGDVVTEGGGGVAVLDEVPARAREGEATREAGDVGDRVETCARVHREGEHDLTGPELAPDELDGQRPKEVLERALRGVERQERHEPVEARQEDQALAPQGYPLRVDADPRSLEPGLVQRDAQQHHGET
jgi:hypothetical protein